MKHIRAFLAVEAAAFATAALVHTGIASAAYRHREARIAESVIAAVLALGLIVVARGGPRSRAVALAVQGFALLGTFVGIGTIAAGIGPQSRFDVALHTGFVTLLVAGLIAAWRRPAQ